MAKSTVERILAEILGKGAGEGVGHDRRDAFKSVPRARSVFGTLTMPNGQVIKTMREDAFQAALAASGNKRSR